MDIVEVKAKTVMDAKTNNASHTVNKKSFVDAWLCEIRGA